MFKLLIVVLCVFFLPLVVGAEVDPTKPFNETVSNRNTLNTNTEQLRLNSIIHGNSVHTAIINGRLLKVGDPIGEYILIQVNDKSVVLSSDDERKVLTVFSTIIIE